MECFARTRKLLERNAVGQFTNTDKIKDYAENVAKEYLAAFPEVDTNDLYLIMSRVLAFECSMEMLRDASDTSQKILNDGGKHDGE